MGLAAKIPFVDKISINIAHIDVIDSEVPPGVKRIHTNTADGTAILGMIAEVGDKFMVPPAGGQFDMRGFVFTVVVALRGFKKHLQPLRLPGRIGGPDINPVKYAGIIRRRGSSSFLTYSEE